MLLELAVGDAYGAGFEYVDDDVIRAHNDLTRFVKHPRHPIVPGNYTDDTQMSIAIAEAIVSGAPWTPQLLADKFVEAFKRDPRPGYARGFYQFLRRIKTGAQFLAEIEPTSDKSGAAMRAAPIGILPGTAQVIERATIQAAITHNTPDGITPPSPPRSPATTSCTGLAPGAISGSSSKRTFPARGRGRGRARSRPRAG